MTETDWSQKLWHLLEDKYDQTVLTGRERVLIDGTRVDILTEHWAIEIDWAHKWAEAIGQAQFYAKMTERRPGIILLCEDMDNDMKYVYRCIIGFGAPIFVVDCKKSLVSTFDNKKYQL